MTFTDSTTEFVIRDGSTICVRQGGERDVQPLLRFLRSLSPQSLYDRFHGRPALNERRMRALLGLDGSLSTTLSPNAGHDASTVARLAGCATSPTRVG